MRTYELAVVLNPELSDDALTSLQGKVADWIAAAGGEVARVEYWGRRRLAYPIGKSAKGLMYFGLCACHRKRPQLWNENCALKKT